MAFFGQPMYYFDAAPPAPSFYPSTYQKLGHAHPDDGVFFSPFLHDPIYTREPRPRRAAVRGR
jgi:hypothetical protein